MAFYDRYERLCRDINKTPTEVGRENGIQQGTISMWKKRGSTPNGTTITKLAAYFSVPASYLTGSYDKKMLGERIRHGREMRSISQKELAKLAGIPIEDIPKYEAGEADIPYKVLSVFADEFGYSTRYMLGETFEFGSKPVDDDMSNIAEMLNHIENTQKIADERIAPQAIALWRRISWLSNENIKRLFDYLAMLEENQRKPKE